MLSVRLANSAGRGQARARVLNLRAGRMANQKGLWGGHWPSADKQSTRSIASMRSGTYQSIPQEQQSDNQTCRGRTIAGLVGNGEQI